MNMEYMISLSYDSVCKYFLLLVKSNSVKNFENDILAREKRDTYEP